MEIHYPLENTVTDKKALKKEYDDISQRQQSQRRIQEVGGDIIDIMVTWFRLPLICSLHPLIKSSCSYSTAHYGAVQ